MALTCAAFVSLKFPTPATLPLLFRERRYRRLRSGPLLLSYLVLLRVGFTLPRASLPERCALTLAPAKGPHLFTLTRPDPGCPGETRRYLFCGTFRIGGVRPWRASPSDPRR